MNKIGIDVGLRTMSICILNETDILLWEVCDMLSEEQVNCDVCGRKAKYITGQCGTHYKGIKNKKNEIKIKKVKSYSLQEICERVITKIDCLFNDHQEAFEFVDDVIIELQPRFNPKMCFVSNVLFTKLCEKFIGTGCKVRFDRAKNKLKNYCGDKGAFVKNTYANRKSKSIEFVNFELTKYDENWALFFNSLAKRDDASDSFLLAFNSLKK
jgi:hypothetical protein